MNRLIIFSCTLVSLSVLFQSLIKGVYFEVCLIGILNVYLILLSSKLKPINSLVFKVFFAYHTVTLIFPTFWLVLFYSAEDVYEYQRLMYISEHDLFLASVFVFLYDLVLILVTVFLYQAVFDNTKKYIQTDRFRVNYLSIFFLIALSFLCKLYLIDIGAWFYFNNVELSNYPFANFAFIYEKLDIIVLTYLLFAYKFTNNKINLNLFLVFVSISLFFALISTSKEKIFLVLIPFVLWVWNSKFRVSFILITPLAVLLVPYFFKFILMYRYNPDLSFLDLFYLLGDSLHDTEHTMKDNVFLGRLNYQFVLARVIQVYGELKNEVGFLYSNNLIGLIPRFIWTDKPNIEIDYNAIGYQLGYVSAYDTATSLGITPLGESFYILGFLGILVTPFMASILLLAIYRLTNMSTWVGISLFLAFGLKLLTTDTYMAILPMFIKSYIMYYLAIYILQKREIKNKV